MSQNDTPAKTPFQLVAQVPGQATKPPTPRQPKPRPGCSKVDQPALPGLLPSGDENMT